jgi:enamine deaminase RidA (YjgF/YER057c/UK114 family)
MPRTVVNSPAYDVPVRESAEQAPFSQAIVVPPGAELIFVSGITSRGADGTLLHEGDIEAQTRQVLDNLRAILEHAGASMGDVVKITTFVRDADTIRLVSRLRREAFGEPAPASSTVEVSRLFDPRQLIEIEAIAAVVRD